MKILITGSTGYVGQVLVPKLVALSYEILVITTSILKAKERYGTKVKYFDYTKETSCLLQEEVEMFEPAVVIHLASHLTASDEYDDMLKLLDANIHFTCNILNAIKNTKVELFINTGSSSEYYRGDDNLDAAYLYSATKSASRVFIDYYSQAFDFNYITVVPYTIYGGNINQGKIVDIIYRTLFSSSSIDLSPGEQILDFIHVQDVTDFYLLLLKHVNKLENKTVFHLGTGVGNSLKEVASKIESITKKRTNINWGGVDYRARDVKFAVANVSKQILAFNWKPKITLEDGLKMYLNGEKSV